MKRERVTFEQAMLPHLKSAFNLARWLTRNEHDAEDVLQEAYLRAFTFFDGFNGANPRTWLLTVVRNCCFTWLQKNRPSEVGTVPDEAHRPAGSEAGSIGPRPETPEDSAVRKSTARQINQALEALAAEFREVFILREMEGLSYKEIAEVSNIPIGTVMSRLSRAREQLQKRLGDEAGEGGQL